MRTQTDFSPLYRSFIGFDHLAGLIEKASRSDKQSSYPPYNVELLAEDQYRITMAIAGFADEDLEIESKENTLIITGTKPVSDNISPRNFLHQGIAERNFDRKFQLGEHVKVIGAFMEHGLLHIDLEREIPEALKSRKIAINGKSLLQPRPASSTNHSIGANES
ncbi:MAG: molecular chaperone IbpA [Colwellia sp.]|jgi:molecular chaperone IbpA